MLQKNAFIYSILVEHQPHSVNSIIQTITVNKTNQIFTGINDTHIAIGQGSYSPKTVLLSD